MYASRANRVNDGWSKTMQHLSLARPFSRARRRILEAMLASSVCALSRPAPASSATLTDVHRYILPDIYLRSLERVGLLEHAQLATSFASAGNWRAANEFERPSGHVSERFEPLTFAGPIARRTIVSIGAAGVFFGDIGFTRDLARSLNEHLAGLVRAGVPYLGAFATVALPSVSAAIAETDYALDQLGLDGVCIYSNYAGARLGDAFLAEYLEYLDGRCATVLINPMLPLERCDDIEGVYVAEITRTVTNLVVTGIPARFSRIRFIVPYLGDTLGILAGQLEILESCLHAPPRCPNYSTQTFARALAQLYYAVPSTSAERLGPALALVEPERLLFGSGLPFTDHSFM